MAINDKDYELLSRYIDGDLSADERKGLEARLSEDMELGTALNDFHHINQRLQSVYAGTAETPIPQHISALLQAPAMPETKVAVFPRRRAANWGFALAASLFVAVAAVQLTQQANEEPYADTVFATALDTLPSRGQGWNTLPNGLELRPVLSFQSKTGAWCREYFLRDDDSGWHGVACYNGQSWETSAVIETQFLDADGHYQPASALDTIDIARYIDQHASGIPLDADQEATRIASGWQ